MQKIASEAGYNFCSSWQIFSYPSPTKLKVHHFFRNYRLPLLHMIGSVSELSALFFSLYIWTCSNTMPLFYSFIRVLISVKDKFTTIIFFFLQGSDCSLHSRKTLELTQKLNNNSSNNSSQWELPETSIDYFGKNWHLCITVFKSMVIICLFIYISSALSGLLGVTVIKNPANARSSNPWIRKIARRREMATYLQLENRWFVIGITAQDELRTTDIPGPSRGLSSSSGAMASFSTPWVCAILGHILPASQGSQASSPDTGLETEK